jgi:hypothetical protein
MQPSIPMNLEEELKARTQSRRDKKVIAPRHSNLLGGTVTNPTPTPLFATFLFYFFLIILV